MLDGGAAASGAAASGAAADTFAADLGDASAWSTAAAGGTEGYGNGANVDVGRVTNMTSAEFSRRGLPPHKAIMIAEDTTIRINNQPHGDLTRGWIKTQYDYLRIPTVNS